MRIGFKVNSFVVPIADTNLRVEKQELLENNLQYARELGAEISKP